MARTPKEAGGIPYFSLDSDTFRDEKIRRIKAQCGMKGIGFLFWLLCEIYAGEGYYIRFSYDDCALLADEAGGGINAELTREVVKSSLKCSFFDCRVFENHGVLTSSRIQKNYLRACERWSAILIDRRYWLLTEKDIKPSTLIKVTLLDVIGDKNEINVYKNSINVDNNAQSKSKNKKIYTYTMEDEKINLGEYGNVLLTPGESEELIRLYGEAGADRRIRMLDYHMEQHKEYCSYNHFLTITQGWVQKAIERDQQKQAKAKPKARSVAGAAFCDFEQRNYDYDKLLREIHGG